MRIPTGFTQAFWKWSDCKEAIKPTPNVLIRSNDERKRFVQIVITLWKAVKRIEWRRGDLKSQPTIILSQCKRIGEGNFMVLSFFVSPPQSRVSNHNGSERTSLVGEKKVSESVGCQNVFMWKVVTQNGLEIKFQGWMSWKFPSGII